MNLMGIDRKEFCKRLGFAYSTVTDWINAEKYPRIDKIEIMANFFGISKADLVEPKNTRPAPSLTAKEEREIESALEDMMHSMAGAAYESSNEKEDLEIFKATLKSAMIQAKRITKKKYTPKKYNK